MVFIIYKSICPLNKILATYILEIIRCNHKVMKIQYNSLCDMKQKTSENM